MIVVGFDLGRKNVKLVTSSKYIIFPSVLGEWRDIKLHNDLGSKAFSGEFQGKKFFAGVLAE